MTALGIAVTTYQRPTALAQAVAAVRRRTHSPYELVVADDGSRDRTAELCRSAAVRLIKGPNRGVAWNKNRALFALSLLGCDPLIVVEDDVHPMVDGWEQEWVDATARWHHVAYLHPKLAQFNLAGSGTAADPFVNPRSTAQCLSVSAEALARVGFLDSRFKGWGDEHVEWTMRLSQAGYGQREVVLPGGGVGSGYVYITGGLATEDAISYRDHKQLEANRDIFRRVLGDPLFRYPWNNDAERRAFLAEQSASGLLVDRPLSGDGLECAHLQGIVGES